MKARRRRVVITSAIIIVFFGILVYTTVGSSFLYYRTPSEIIADESLHGKSVKVSGKVVDGTIESSEGTHRFKVTDGKESVLVVYSDVLPSAFKADADVIVEGVYESGSGAIKAESLLAKCPSKYTSQE